MPAAYPEDESTVKNHRIYGVFWNTLAGLVLAGQPSIVLIFVSHCLDTSAAGIVTIAFAVANLFYAATRYGVRTYQVTDIFEKYSFFEYLINRGMTLAASLLLLVLYLWYLSNSKGCSLEKAVIILEITLWKLFDAAEDVLIGRFQQAGRLDIGAKIMALRLLVSTSLICVLIWAGYPLWKAFLYGLILSFFIDIIGIYKKYFLIRPDQKKKSCSIRKAANLLKECGPLCFMSVLSIYIGNAPKYMIDQYMDEQVQAVFGYLMMPAFVVVMLSNFMYVHSIKKIGIACQAGSRQILRQIVFRQCRTILLLTIVMLPAGVWVGLPILSVVYGMDLGKYSAEFAVLFIGGGFYALAVYLNVPMTAIRKQTWMAGFYFFAFCLAVFCGKFAVYGCGIMGAAGLYLLLNAALAAIFLFMILYFTASM